jgi:hypothetical protein
MTSNILQICAIVITVSITSVIAAASLLFVAGVFMVITGKDHD